MIRAGDSFENTATGTRIVFRKTARETGGAAVVVEVFLQPNGFLPVTHVHPGQEERVQVLRGSVGVRIGAGRTVAGPGSALTVPPGTAHRLWNAGDEPAHVVCELRPALQFESLVETLFTLAAEGKTNRRGLPSPLRLAVIAAAHFDTVRAPFPPPFVQRVALASCAAAGRAIGYRPTHSGVAVPIQHHKGDTQ